MIDIDINRYTCIKFEVYGFVLFEQEAKFQPDMRYQLENFFTQHPP